MHSVFARALLETLETNEQVLTAPELFLQIQQLVRRTNRDAASAHDPSSRLSRTPATRSATSSSFRVGG